MQTIASNQASAEVPINENFANVLWAELFARNPVTSSGLTWGYKGGQWLVNGAPTTVADGTLTLTASATNYVGVTQAGVVATSTTANPLHTPLYTVVTGASTVTSYIDQRSPMRPYGIGTQAMADANQTLTQALALCDSLVTTDALTATRNLVVPLVRRAWTVRNSCTGGSVQVIGATGTGVTIAAGSVAQVECDGTNVLATGINAHGLFYKSDPTAVAFSKLTAGTAEIKAGTVVDIAGTTVTFAAATSIVMPTLTAGTDYAIYACTDGTVRADASFSAPSGYTTANSRKIGGFHYAPGGNATGVAGGDTTPAINEYSFWDLKFKPSCPDPRGMTLVAGGFWADIYLTGVDHYTNGTSKYNVTIADSSSPPKLPALFGGNGSTAYSTYTWWEAGEVLRSHGKRLPTYDEFAALAYGTTEASSDGTDPVSTILRAAYTSKWGVMLATGNLWQWGAEFGGGAGTADWTANTGGRGSTYQLENASLFGGGWGGASGSGSRCSLWNNQPTISNNSFGSRAVADLLIFE